MNVPNPEGRGLVQNPCIPDVMGVQDMAEQTGTVLRDKFKPDAGFDKLFITVEIVIEKLMKESLHGGETLKTGWLPPSRAGRVWL